MTSDAQRTGAHHVHLEGVTDAVFPFRFVFSTAQKICGKRAVRRVEHVLA